MFSQANKFFILEKRLWKLFEGEYTFSWNKIERFSL